ncbi:MAG: DNA polymerase III subunit alpha [Deltaproteobacteria bacterium]|nr:DNA polymerase III subunit alpha [Deltaproteobacteria bacterium]
MPADFTHLHLHTLYSLLDGAIRLPDLMKTCAATGMKSVAVTDHGNMFGVVNFYQEAKKNGIKPIIGFEAYVAGDKGRADKSQRIGNHLVLLAQNDIGYKNLRYLSTKAFTEGFYYDPRIDKELLNSHNEGIIALTACMAGAVPKAIRRGDMDEARRETRELKQIFGDRLYLEIQSNALKEQLPVNHGLCEISRDEGIPLVATADSHYVGKSDAKAHEVLMAIASGRTFDDPKRLRHETEELYIKSPDEMVNVVEGVTGVGGEWREAVHNSWLIAQRCNVEIDLKSKFLPKYQVPEGESLDTFMAQSARKGLDQRFKELKYLDKIKPDEYRERLELELGVIMKMQFSGYFLIVADFINWAKKHGIPVGPGRGSGAGSLVAYSLRITDIDPLPYNLLFERFLNPERVSMPDFDVDFCQDRRGEVIEYVTNKYGKDNVAQIVTYGALSAKSAIKDVARVMGLPFAEVNELTRNIPALIDGHPPTIDGALAAEPKLTAIQESKPIFKTIIDFARALEGLTRSTGMHAAGVVIGEKPLWEYVPLCRGQNGELVTQFAKDEVELAGLIKFDFLGLKTLTVISDAVKLANRGRAADQQIDITLLPLDDKKVYELISRGDTAGVFQMESSGFTEMVKKLKPSVFEDIIAAGALYRPGPLDSGMVDVFINRKHGRERVTYPHPRLEGILKDTYGVIVYQEQVMQIAQVLGGYSLGRADLLRRAMGKKKAEVMAKERSGFLEGCEKGGVDPKVANDIFDLMEKFAEYGFNKSHSAAYGLITYQTAWLKAHFPVEFMAALLTSEKDNTDKVVAHIAEARADGIVVLQPDVNDSDLAFGVAPNPAYNPNAKRGTKQAANLIRFGLGAIKGVGENSIDAILVVREPKDKAGAQLPKAPFRGLFDFCSRIDSKKLNRKTVEALVAAGAFDFMGKPRKALWDAIEPALAAGSSAQKDRDSGQFGLFGAPVKKSSLSAAPPPPEERVFGKEEWPERDRLAKEKEAIGFYITGHPLARYEADVKRYATHTCASLAVAKGFEKVGVCGIVTGWRERLTKTGKKIAFAVLEDLTGARNLVMYDDVVQKFETLLKGDDPVLVKGMVRLAEKFGADANQEAASDPEPEIKVDEVQKLADVRAAKASKVELRVNADAATPEKLGELKGLFVKHPGLCSAQLILVQPGVAETKLALKAFKVAPDDDLLAAVDRLFGEKVASVR